MIRVSKNCNNCKNVYTAKIQQNIIKCDKCKGESFFFNSKNLNFEQCSFCNCREFYKRKDFNQNLGCFFVVIGSILLPFTYGISLVVVLIIDMLLHKYIDEVIVCYKCKMALKPECISCRDLAEKRQFWRFYAKNVVFCAYALGIFFFANFLVTSGLLIIDRYQKQQKMLTFL